MEITVCDIWKVDIVDSSFIPKSIINTYYFDQIVLAQSFTNKINMFFDDSIFCHIKATEPFKIY